jgi:hypothetical protein
VILKLCGGQAHNASGQTKGAQNRNSFKDINSLGFCKTKICRRAKYIDLSIFYYLYTVMGKACSTYGETCTKETTGKTQA